MNNMLPQPRTTLSAELATLAALDAPPPWHVLQPLIEAAARHTLHVQGCAACDTWTPEPDDLGRCDQCAIACDGCARALGSEDDGLRTANGRLLCETCAADRQEDRGRAMPARPGMPMVGVEGGKVFVR
jgi:hypothetical protein